MHTFVIFTSVRFIIRVEDEVAVINEIRDRLGISPQVVHRVGSTHLEMTLTSNESQLSEFVTWLASPNLDLASLRS